MSPLEKCRNVLACLFLGVSGCAVMQIDVDVYKGPLANHADVQTEQLTALAMAAKPLLIGLRDDLEGINVRVNTVYRGDEPQACWDYKPDFMPRPEKSSRQSWFINEDAIRVNAALSLYKPKTDPQLATFEGEARELVARYRTAWNQFRVVDSDRVLEAEINKHEPQEITDKSLSQAIAAFLGGNNEGFRNTKPLVDEIKKATSTIKSTMIDQSKEHLELAGANAHLSLLSDPSVANQIVSKAFGKASADYQKSLATRIAQIAQGFLDARAATTRLFEVTLEQMTAVGQSKNFNRDKALPKMATLAQELVLRTALYEGLSYLPASPYATALIDRLKVYLPAKFFPEDGKATDVSKLKPTDEMKLSLEFALAKAILANPAGTVDDLRRFHMWFRSAPVTVATPSFPDPASRQYGIARISPKSTSPSGSEDSTKATLVSAANIDDIVSQAVLASGVGFENGRSPRGLEGLIDEYLKLSQARRDAEAAGRGGPQTPEARNVLRAREDLSESLIHFAEKVTFLANNGAILESKGEQKRSKTYRAMLQLIGNSILVAADELKHQADFKDVSRRQQLADSQGRGIAAAMPSDPSAIFDQFVGMLRQSGELLDSVELTRLKAELDQATSEVAATKLKRQELSDAKEKLSVAMQSNQPLDTAKSTLMAPLAKACADEINNLAAPPAYEQALKALVDKLKPLALAAAGDEKTRLETTISVVEMIRKKPGSGSASKPIDRLMEEIEAARIDAKPLEKRVADLTSQLQNLEGAESKEKAAATRLADQQKNAFKRASEAADQLFARRESILATLPKSADPRRAMKSTMLAKLKEDSSATTPGAVADAIAGLSGLPELPTSPILADAKDPREVIDDLLAKLRYEHVQAIQMYGKENATPRHLEEAIQQAETYRSGMVYIRPPSVYLRTANPASFLQQGGAARDWQNMLFRHGLRSTPLLGEGITNLGQNTALLNEMDKQFWQNINQVRVGAVGITNYVVAKDDIGNWTVKNYGADPTPIIKAAQAVTLYGASQRLGQDLIAKNNIQERKARGEQVDETVSPSILNKQAKQFRENYVTKTNDDATAIRAFAVEASERIQGEFGSAESTKSQSAILKGAIDGVAKDPRFVVAIPDKPDAAKSDDVGAQIITTLRSVRFLQSAALSAIDALNLENEMKIDDKKVSDLRTAAQTSENARQKTAGELLDLSKTEASLKSKLEEANTNLAKADLAKCEAEKAESALTPNPPPATAIPATQAQLDAQRRKEEAIKALAVADNSQSNANNDYQAAVKASAAKAEQLKTEETKASADKTAYDKAVKLAKDVTSSAKKIVIKQIDATLNSFAESRLETVRGYSDAVTVVRQSVQK